MTKATSSQRAVFKARLPAHLHSEFDRVKRSKLKLSVPLAVALHEATYVARFFDTFWRTKSKSGRMIRPGLERAGSQLPPSTGEEIRELIRGIRASESELASRVGERADVTKKKARAALRDLITSLEWRLADPSVLRSLRSVGSSRDRTRDGLTHDLAVCVRLARKHQRRPSRASHISPHILKDAEEVLDLLKQMSERGPAAMARARSLESRNRLVEMLARRVALVRTAARDVFFEDHPDIIRKVTSAYDRQRRRANRASANMKIQDFAPVRSKRKTSTSR